MCLMIAAGQTLFFLYMSGTAFAKYSFPLKKFWFILFALFMILPIQVTLLPNYILLEKTKTFKQLESFDNPCNIFHLLNCMAYFRFPGNPRFYT